MSYISNWYTAYDVDFTSVGTTTPQTFSSDGSWTIDGHVWTKSNTTTYETGGSTGLASKINSSGITFQPNGSNADYNGSRNIPNLWIPFTSIVPSFSLNGGVRLWFYISSFAGTANYDNSVVAIDTNSTSHGYVFKRGYGTAGTGIQCFGNNSGTNATGFISSSASILNTTDNVGMIEVTNFSAPYQLISTFKGTYSSGWPAYSSLTFLTTGIATNTYSGTTSGIGITLGAQRVTNTSGISTTTYARMRVDYRP